MIAPTSTQMTSVLPDTASVTLKPEVSSTVPSQPQQTDRTVTPPANQSQPVKDTVQLSNTALSMSKALNEQADQRSELKREAAKTEQTASEAKASSYAQAGKAYPPFIGNTEELKKLKESSPALYREVLRMIVPPPLNLSPTDLQMLQGGNTVVQDTKTEIATA